MPVSKKPRAKKAADKAWPRPGAADAAALPDRRTMERFLAALGGSRGGGNDPTEKAQDLMYDAWERTTARSRIALARKALGISPRTAARLWGYARAVLFRELTEHDGEGQA